MSISVWVQVLLLAPKSPLCLVHSDLLKCPLLQRAICPLAGMVDKTVSKTVAEMRIGSSPIADTNTSKAEWQHYSNKGNNKYTNLFDNDELDKNVKPSNRS